ncbi:MAG: hypothetical protein D6750_00890 [Bacteroidetes bacterium]|nr:MAG: hypothetical protein D6750_00890 [Bacteroidota bacterium]
MALDEAVGIETGNLWEHIEWLAIKPVLESLPEEDQILLSEYAAVDGDINSLAKTHGVHPDHLLDRINSLIRYIRQEVGLDDEPIQ